MAQIVIDLNTPLLEVSGKETKETLAHILSNRMVYTNKGDSVKMYDWAISLWKNGKISVDRSDLEAITKFVEEDKEVANLVRAQLLIKLKEAK